VYLYSLRKGKEKVTGKEIDMGCRGRKKKVGGESEGTDRGEGGEGFTKFQYETRVQAKEGSERLESDCLALRPVERCEERGAQGRGRVSNRGQTAEREERRRVKMILKFKSRKACENEKKVGKIKERRENNKKKNGHSNL